MSNRIKAIEWFNSMDLEQKFYHTIEANHLLVGDTIDNHPNRLTGREIEIIYDYNFDNSSIVRTNMLNDRNYTGYCGDEFCKPRTTSHPDRWPRTKWNNGQFKCGHCGWESKFPKTFIKLWKETHNIN